VQNNYTQLTDNHDYSHNVVLTQFIRKLDNRHEKNNGKGKFQTKNRVLGSPSKLSPQQGPKWAINAPESEEEQNLSVESVEEGEEGSGVDNDASDSSDVFSGNDI
jgi:hypothetical protein